MSEIDDFQVQGTPDDQIPALTNQQPPAPAKETPNAQLPTAPKLADQGVAAVDDEAADDADSERDQHGRFRQRHRARSQQAGPEDVPRIAALTKKLRETEAKYEARIAALETAHKPKVEPPPARPQVQRPAPAQFTEQEPVIDQFADQPDPYASWIRAVNAFDRKKELFDARQAHQAKQTEAQSKQHDEHFSKWVEARQQEHDARLDAFVKATPEAKEHWQKVADMPVTPVLMAAIQLHEAGPQFMLALAREPALLDELYMLTDGKLLGDPLNNPLVASVQRRLLARVQAVHTGSAAPPQKMVVAPRPPNPVRTTPHTPADSLPGDDDSLEAHEKVWGPQRRSRRR